MKTFDVNNIIVATENKIGIYNYEKEGIMRRKRFKIMGILVLSVAVIGAGTFTVDALTDNSIKKAVDDLVKVKVNGNEYNSTCVDSGDGTIKCKVGSTGVEYSVTDEAEKYDINLDVTEDGNETKTADMTISNKN